MADLTDPPFRRLLARIGGCDLFYTPMLTPAALRARQNISQQIETGVADAPPLCVQLAPVNGDEALESIRRLVDMASFDAVDINMGCAAPRLRKRGAGAALLADRSRVEAIVEAIRRVWGGPLSVKTRLPGDGGADDLADHVSFLEGLSVAWVCVHGRLPKEGFTRTARWDVIEDLSRSCSIPVVGSGGLFTAGGAVRRLHESGCAAVMLARGALRDPWIFARARALLDGEPEPEVTATVIAAAVEELFDDIFGYYPAPGRARVRVGMIAGYLLDPFPFGRRVAHKIAASRDFEEQKNLALDFLRDAQSNGNNRALRIDN